MSYARYYLVSKKELYNLLIEHHKLQVYENIIENICSDVDSFIQIEEKEQLYVKEKLKGYGIYSGEDEKTHYFSDIADYEMLSYGEWHDED